MKLSPLLSIALLAACATQAPAPVVAQSSTQAVPASAPAPAPMADDREARFQRWKSAKLADLSARFDPALVARVVGPMALRPQVVERDTNQPEFVRPVWGYIDSAVTPSRLEPGRENLVAYDDVFRRVGERYRVDPEYLTAIWGLETSYGANMGGNALVDAFGTLGFEGRRAEFFSTQLDTLVELVAEGKLAEDQLIGSWAGATGQTQFIPTTIRDYAVDMDGNGRFDLRESELDALGSAAHYLSRSGWVAGQPAMVEVALPDGFDYGLGDGRTKRSVGEWLRLGVQPSPEYLGDPSLLNARDEAKLLVPAGARGPKFLLLKNFDVIKRYNPSTSYAMGITALAETLKGRDPIRAAWPRDDRPLTSDDNRALQARLNQLGYNVGEVDGIVGPATRSAVRDWQRANGLTPDGYVEQGLLARILG